MVDGRDPSRILVSVSTDVGDDEEPVSRRAPRTGEVVDVPLDDAEWLAAIVRAQLELLAPDELEDVVRLTAERMQLLTKADGAGIAVVEGDELRYVAAAGNGTPFIGLRLSLASTLTGLCVRTGELVVCDDSETDPRVDHALAKRVGARSFVAVPILQGSDARGVLAVMSSRPRRFDARAMDTMLLMVAPIAAALARAEQSRSLTALRESEERMRLMIEHAPIGMAFLGPDGSVTRVNQRLCEMVGYSATELSKFEANAIVHPDDVARTQRLMTQLIEGTIPRFRVAKRYVRKDGTILDATLHASLLRDDHGKPCGVIAQIEDDTERKRSETRLALSDRMSSIGTLAGGIAHEINNPLSYILSNLEIAAEELRAADPGLSQRTSELLELVDEARNGADRVRVIVGDLKTFSRIDVEQRVPLDLHGVIEKALKLAWNEIRHRAQLVKELGPVPLVLGDEPRLTHVLINLLVNAAQSIREGHADKNEIRVVTFTGDDGRAVVIVRDTGSGIAKEVIGRVFDPFFTTKDVGTGPGLGLSVSHAIVSAHGGEISASSEPGAGTEIRVVLPAASPAPASDPQIAIPLDREGMARGRVLVIDDDTVIAGAMKRVVARNHDVFVETSGEQAIQRFESGERFDVILCDVIMPKSTGMDVYRSVQQIDPSQAERFVFVTGGAFTPEARAFLETVPNARINKPFDTQTLRRIVDTMVVRNAAAKS